jgi:hypothetical protein
MGSADRLWIFEPTKHALQHLAAPAEVQIALLPDFVCVTDELSLDFDHWRSTFIGNYGSELTPGQAALFEAIDEKFARLSRRGAAFREEFWTNDALRESPEWENFRQLAIKLLDLLGWPVEIPPSCAHEYVQGRPRRA